MSLVYVGEDSEVERQLLGLILDKLDQVQVRMFDNGLDLWFACLETTPDLIILDLLLTSLNGFDFCRLMRGHESMASSPPIVAVSSMPSERVQTEILNAGAQRFVQKPFEPQSFQTVLGDFLLLAR